jgi:DNA replication protein DnaC
MSTAARSRWWQLPGASAQRRAGWWNRHRHKTHLAIAIARACIHHGARGRFFNGVDLVNKLEAEGRSGRQGRIAEQLCRMEFIVLDELGYLLLALSGGQLLSHLISRL